MKIRNYRVFVPGIRWRNLACAVLVLAGLVQPAAAETGTNAVIAVVREYERAANSRDTALFRRILALDDPRFREIEDHIPEPFGRRVAVDILRWVEEHPDFEFKVTYKGIQAFLLSESAAYAIATTEWSSPESAGKGRVTFVLIKDGGHGWRILHGHWSEMPER